jgi:hypothetical protein
MVFSGTPVSSTNKTDCHNNVEILLRVVLNTGHPKPNLLPSLLQSDTCSVINQCDVHISHHDEMYTGITFVMFVLFIYICIIYMYVLKISICIYKDSYNSPKWVQDSPFSVGTHQSFLILHFLQWFQDSAKFSEMSSTSVLIKIDCYKYSCIWSITCYQRKYTINNVN